MSPIGVGQSVPRHAAIRRIVAACALASLSYPALAASSVNDFPTSARADYVFACMAVNGQTREALEKCACSVDVIASLMPYEAYEEAETILSIRLRGGDKSTAMFNSMGMLKEKVDRLKRAQVEGELRCF